MSHQSKYQSVQSIGAQQQRALKRKHMDVGVERTLASPEGRKTKFVLFSITCAMLHSLANI
jgi:hypothetical protein